MNHTKIINRPQHPIRSAGRPTTSRIQAILSNELDVMLRWYVYKSGGSFLCSGREGGRTILYVPRRGTYRSMCHTGIGPRTIHDKWNSAQTSPIFMVIANWADIPNLHGNCLWGSADTK